MSLVFDPAAFFNAVSNKQIADRAQEIFDTWYAEQPAHVEDIMSEKFYLAAAALVPRLMTYKSGPPGLRSTTKVNMTRDELEDFVLRYFEIEP